MLTAVIAAIAPTATTAQAPATALEGAAGIRKGIFETGAVRFRCSVDRTILGCRTTPRLEELCHAQTKVIF
jgi:hypothetical protein